MNMIFSSFKSSTQGRSKTTRNYDMEVVSAYNFFLVQVLRNCALPPYQQLLYSYTFWDIKLMSLNMYSNILVCGYNFVSPKLHIDSVIVSQRLVLKIICRVF
jgi:hypothetical protein